eukprot:SAG31_NODE_379_length_16485_cov_3.654583_14_plen_1011_part_00
MAVVLLAFGLYGLSHLDAEDALYGNNCGGQPPSHALLQKFVDQTAYAELQEASWNNHTVREGSDASQQYSSGSWNRPDGESCEDDSQCDGICVDICGHEQCADGTGERAGTCALSDYPQMSAAKSEKESVLYFFAEACFSVCLFMVTMGLTWGHQPYFGASWKVSFGLLLAGGHALGMGYSPSGPILMIVLLFFFPSGFVMVPTIAYLFFGLWWLNGNLFAESADQSLSIRSLIGQEPLTDMLSMNILGYPVLAAVLLAVSLSARVSKDCARATCCEKDTPGWQRTAHILQQLSSATAPARQPRVLARAVSITAWTSLGLLGLSVAAPSKASFLSDLLIDCSGFTPEEMRGMQAIRHGDAKLCYLYPSMGMVPCGQTVNYNDNDLVRTGMYGTEDPLANDFLRNLWLYDFGRGILAAASILAIFSATPEVNPKSNLRNGSSDKRTQWNFCLILSGIVGFLAVYLMVVGVEGMFNIDAEDVPATERKFGPTTAHLTRDGTPPLGPLQPFVDSDDILSLVDYAGLAEIEETNRTSLKLDGAECYNDAECLSSICKQKDNGQNACVLASVLGSGVKRKQQLRQQRKDLIVAPYWSPVYATGALAASSFLPKQFFGPSMSTTFAGAVVVTSTASWFNWAGISSPTDWYDMAAFARDILKENPHDQLPSLRSAYNKLVDCSDFTTVEMRGARSIQGYICYDAPTPESVSARFRVDSGPCNPVYGGICVEHWKDRFSGNCQVAVTGGHAYTSAYIQSEQVELARNTDIDLTNTEETIPNYSGHGQRVILDEHSARGHDGQREMQFEWFPNDNLEIGSDGGWPMLCLVAKPPIPMDKLLTLPIDSMVSQLIPGPQPRNPVLAAWALSCTLYIGGVALAMGVSLWTLLFAYPLTCKGFWAGLDTVCCCGICCRIAARNNAPKSGTALNLRASTYTAPLMSMDSMVPMAPVAPPAAAPVPPAHNPDSTAVPTPPTQSAMNPSAADANLPDLFCSNCGARRLSESTFCEDCGARQDDDSL